jgi:hypothetical protein
LIEKSIIFGENPVKSMPEENSNVIENNTLYWELSALKFALSAVQNRQESF